MATPALEGRLRRLERTCARLLWAFWVATVVIILSVGLILTLFARQARSDCQELRSSLVFYNGVLSRLAVTTAQDHSDHTAAELRRLEAQVSQLTIPDC